jgi:putative membrane protein
MKAIRLALLELRRFRGRVLFLVPIVLVLVPLLYGALYLWANWDPYGRLDRVPVAVVNSDKPVDRGGQRIEAGKRFVEQIRGTELFDWNVVDHRTAQRGLEEGRFYFTIEVPKDFSARLATAAETVPKRAALRITKNDANGYVAGIMADTVKSELQNQVNAAAHAAYAHALYGKLGTVRDKLRLASEASDQLVTGTDLSKQGTATLTTGLGGVRDGSADLSDGVRQVSDATARLEGQLNSVTSSASDELGNSANAMVNASNRAVARLSGIAGRTGAADQRAGNGVSSLEALGEAHPSLRSDSLYRQALSESRQSSTATARADGDAQLALAAAQEAQQQAQALQSEVMPLQQRIQSISEPLAALRAGTAQLSTGSTSVTTGLTTMTDSSRVLQTGAGQLHDGANRVKGLVDDSLMRIPPTNPSQITRAGDVLGSPSQITTHNLHPAHVYGRGLAPFFFSIALWVFGLIAYLLLKPVNLRALASRVNPATIAVAGWLPAAFLGAVGGLVLYGVADLALGLAPQNIAGTLGLVALAAGTFVAIDHFLRTALGTVGGLVSLVLLVLQIVGSGGLYPVETTPEPLQAIHDYLPMSYLVDGLRVTISGGMEQHLQHDFTVLAAVLVGFLILTTVVVQRHRTWTPSRLHPRLAL